MPEGPEVHRVADDLADVFVGRRLRRVFFGRPSLKPWEKRLARAQVEGVRVRGEAVVLRLKPGLFVYSRVRASSGRWYVGTEQKRPKGKRRVGLSLHADDRAAVLYDTSEVEVLTADQLRRHPFLSRLGPDVLDPSLDDNQICERFLHQRFARRQLAGLLVDPSFVAGVGDVLRSEVLYAARLAPSRRHGSLEQSERLRLVHSLRELSLHAYRARDTRERYAVYGRAGAKCRNCRSKVLRKRSAGHWLFWCPRCQG